jgi:transposase, IS5 family
MIRYTSQHQLSISGFKTPFEQSLLPTNRWVLLSSALPWDDLAQVYHRQMSIGMGRGSVNTRLVIGVLIIKHILKLDDREVLATLQENVYLQYFVGYSSFQTKIAFDPSLLVTLRKRMGLEAFDEWSQAVIRKIEAIESAQLEGTKDTEIPNKIDIKSNINTDVRSTQTSDEAKTETKIAQTNTPIALTDTLIIDTTVAEQKIKYPTDIDLLNNVREFTEELIDIFYEASPLKVKPRTYRNIARKDYLNAALKRKKSSKEVRKAIKKQLSYIERNIFTINTLWDMLVENNTAILFSKSENRGLYKKWLVCQEIYRQQKEMIDRNVKFCDNRIVSIDQPHVRPILRGKANKNIEFGSKVALSVVNGTNRIYRISWDAYNDGVDLIGQVQAYKKQYKQYPKLVLADEIYMTKANRAFLKENNIEHRGKPLGRPKKDEKGNKIKSYNAFQQQQANQRNHVEGQFGTAKDSYALNKVKAKTTLTSESWIANIFFILNINRLLKIVQKAMPDILGSFLKTLKSTFFPIFRGCFFVKKYQFT